jgi:RHS repeat-associated protein
MAFLSLAFSNIFITVSATISISGPTCVVAGGTTGYTYTLSGTWTTGNVATWTVNGGIITANSSSQYSGTLPGAAMSVHVIWNQNATGAYIQLAVTTQTPNPYTLNVTVITIPATLTPASQSVNYGSALTLTGGAPTSGCSPTYSFWWESSSSSSGPFNTISGQTGQNLTVNPAVQKTYYRRASSFNGDVVYTNVALIDINPLNVGSISTSNGNVTYNAQPSITQAAATGGFCSTLNYEWQQSVDGGPWQAVGTGAAYPAGAPAIVGNTLIRRKVICSDQELFTNTLSFTVTYTSTNTENLNYIRTNSIIMPGVVGWAQADQLSIGQKIQSTSYFDGLGRSIETVQKQISPLQKDLVAPTVYDNFGREVTKYLPYVSATSDGKYKSTPLTEQNSFNSAQFPGEQYYYSQINFDNSPDSRVQTTYAPGLNWVGASRGVNTQYLVNTLSGDSVRKWTISSTAGSLPATLSGNSGIYADGLLYKFITTNEQNQQVVEYKDMDGKVILKKVQVATTPGTAHVGWLCTYYVYDDFSNLRFVLQPRAVELINSTWAITQAIADELCFRYEYDLRNRMSVKKVPGAGEVRTVYDLWDRIVLSQDANLRTTNQWIFTKYDAVDRMIMTGLYTNSTYTTQSTMQSYLNGQNMGRFESPVPTTLPLYTLTQSFPSEVMNDIQSMAYFDDYGWTNYIGASFRAFDNSYNSNFFTPSNTTFPYPQTISATSNSRGLNTGSIYRVPGVTLLATTNFYDDRNRMVQTKHENTAGDYDMTTTQYTFTGQVLMTLLRHSKPTNSTMLSFVFNKYSYDYGGRLLTVKNTINTTLNGQYSSFPEQLIATNTYNELGQLQNKSFGNNIENLAYEYNIRGWLKSINKNYVAGTSSTNYFGMELGYDKSNSANTTTSYQYPQFNGNIAGAIWRSAGDGIGRKYDYKYDLVNRITRAEFVQNTAGTTWDANTLNFSVWGFDSDNGYGMKYDANGNILMMIQGGYKALSSTIVDAMHYTYVPNTNKIQQVWDDYNDASTKLGDFHFNPATKTATDYTYDLDGNLISDNNKAITSITYNYLNLPLQITISGKGTITYVYDAQGNKLSKTTVDNTVTPSKTTLTTYMAGFVYQATSPPSGGAVGADTLQYVPHSEGRARWAYHKYLNGTMNYGIEYDYFVKDHLGNTRVVLTQQKDTTKYLATMEGAYRSTETQLFGNITTSVYARAAASGYPVDLTITNPNDSVMRVNGNGQKVGPNLLLKVMSGDKIDIAVQYYFNNIGTPQSPVSSFNDILNSLANGIVTMTAGAKGAASDILASTSPVYTGLTSFLSSNDPTPGTKPKAYLNWILLDEQLRYVNSYPQSGAAAVATAGTNGGVLQAPLGNTGIPITKSGYLYIWVSNETPAWDVFFDNLSIKQYSGPMLEETHYYPFGLAISGISSKALKPNYAENKYKFNDGCELANKEFSDGSGLELYETDFRNFDSQIGRFHQIDPLGDFSENWSPYSYVMNNPLQFNDPWGLDTVTAKVKRPVNKKPGTEVVVDNSGGGQSSYIYDPTNPAADNTGMVSNGMVDPEMKPVVVTPGSGGGSDDNGSGSEPATPPDPTPSPGPNPPTPGPSTPGESKTSYFDKALQFEGVPYVSGGASPKGFDCSGLVCLVTGQIGHTWSTKGNAPPPGDWNRMRPSTSSYNNFLNDVKRGDLFVWRSKHTAFYAGFARMFGAHRENVNSGYTKDVKGFNELKQYWIGRNGYPEVWRQK